MSKLYEKTLYTNDITYLTNVLIREYDISKANINVLYAKNLISENTYQFLKNAPRMTRQVYVGKMLRADKSLALQLKEGILEARRMLFETNDVQDYEVLSIKNDAVYTINRQLQNTDFGLIRFMEKNIYTAYYALPQVEIYYYYNYVSKEEQIDIKGINDETLKLHNDYFLQFLKDLFYTVQVTGIEAALDLMRNFYYQYITMQLPIGYYRKFNSDSNYHYKYITSEGTGFNLMHVKESEKANIDITYNVSILMQIQKILMDIYYVKYK